MSLLIDSIFFFLLIFMPIALSICNITLFITYLIKKKEKKFIKFFELGAIFIGIFYVFLYWAIVDDYTFSDWNVQLHNSQAHSMISTNTFLTIGILLLIGLVGYLLIRLVPAQKLSPVLCAGGIAAVYLGTAVLILCEIQICKDVFFSAFFVNLIIVYIKSVFIIANEKNRLFQNGEASTKFSRLSKILNKGTNLPWIALIIAIPMFGVITIILMLFGQSPDSIIKAWTDTADWTMSQKIAPQNVMFDEHYLCTVAAGGHKKVVKPIRTGMRHGHKVLVNRQLCVANAFEQVLEEKTPAIHKIIRKIYDSTGYPISKHIHSKFVADIIYFIMKPLEWIFLLVLYTVDVNPENRISVQYPHSAVPKKN